jgi:hypothetical protein
MPAHLARIDLIGVDPIAALAEAAASRELGTAEDLAAVLDYRLDPKGTGSIGTGPLPWLPALPAAVRAFGSAACSNADRLLTVQPTQERQGGVASLPLLVA